MTQSTKFKNKIMTGWLRHKNFPYKIYKPVHWDIEEKGVRVTLIDAQASLLLDQHDLINQWEWKDADETWHEFKPNFWVEKKEQ